MATWMKSGSDFNSLLAEAAQIDPDIADALGDSGPFSGSQDLMHVVAGLCHQELYDADGDSVDQSVEISLNYLTWTRKGKGVMVEGRRSYGAREPGFYLRIGQQAERLPQGPKEWTPKEPVMVYNFMLTLAKEKSRTERKMVAKNLGWELLSG